MARADFNVRAGKVAWRYTALAALFFVHGLLAAVPRAIENRLGTKMHRGRCDVPGGYGPQF